MPDQPRDQNWRPRGEAPPMRTEEQLATDAAITEADIERTKHMWRDNASDEYAGLLDAVETTEGVE